MILLSGHSLTPARRVPVESLSLSLKERESTATMTPADMTGITIDSWLQDDTEPGKGIVYRVKSIQQIYATDTPTVTLEHAIGILQDRILFGEVTAETIGGSSTCSAEAAIRYILNQQSDWVLGTFGYSGVSGAYKFDGDNLFDALERVCTTLNECWWSYDFTRYPFRLNIGPKPAGVACELRPGRNLATVTKTVDRSRMYTRFYPVGKDDLHISGDYVSRNENLYGVVSKVEVDTSLETEAELRAWANERLSKHAEPAVNVTADGLELAAATGETIDRLTLGRICRIPLTEFNTTIEERIVELNYRDKVHEPENVRVTMANQHEDIAKIVAQAIKEGGGPSGSGRGGGGRGGAKQQKEDHAWFEDTDEHVAMCAEGIVGTDAEGNPNWIRLSQIVVDGEGIHQQVQSIQGDLVIQEARIEVAEDRITAEVHDRTQKDTEMSSKITQTASQISAEVRRASAAEGQLSSRISVNAEGISTKVSKNGVISAINQTAESVTIMASRINLTGYVTASQLSAVEAQIANLATGQTQALLLSCFNLDWRGNRLVSKTITINGTVYHLMGY